MSSNPENDELFCDSDEEIFIGPVGELELKKIKLVEAKILNENIEMSTSLSLETEESIFVNGSLIEDEMVPEGFNQSHSVSVNDSFNKTNDHIELPSDKTNDSTPFKTLSSLSENLSDTVVYEMMEEQCKDNSHCKLDGNHLDNLKAELVIESKNVLSVNMEPTNLNLTDDLADTTGNKCWDKLQENSSCNLSTLSTEILDNNNPVTDVSNLTKSSMTLDSYNKVKENPPSTCPESLEKVFDSVNPIESYSNAIITDTPMCSDVFDKELDDSKLQQSISSVPFDSLDKGLQENISSSFTESSVHDCSNAILDVSNLIITDSSMPFEAQDKELQESFSCGDSKLSVKVQVCSNPILDVSNTTIADSSMSFQFHEYESQHLSCSESSSVTIDSDCSDGIPNESKVTNVDSSTSNIYDTASYVLDPIEYENVEPLGNCPTHTDIVKENLIKEKDISISSMDDSLDVMNSTNEHVNKLPTNTEQSQQLYESMADNFDSETNTSVVSTSYSTNSTLPLESGNDVPIPKKVTRSPTFIVEKPTVCQLSECFKQLKVPHNTPNQKGGAIHVEGKCPPKSLAFNKPSKTPKRSPMKFLTPQLKPRTPYATYSCKPTSRSRLARPIESPVARYIKENPPPQLIVNVKSTSGISPHHLSKERQILSQQNSSNQPLMEKSKFIDKSAITKPSRLPVRNYSAHHAIVVDKENTPISNRRRIATPNPQPFVFKHTGHVKMARAALQNANPNESELANSTLLEVSVLEKGEVART